MYLLSGMDDEGYISIQSVLYHLSQKLIFASIEDAIESVRNSDKVVIDEAQYKIRPNIDVERKTIILRDIVDSTEDEIRSIFDGIAPIESVKPPVENTWFLRFPLLNVQVCRPRFRSQCSSRSSRDSKQTVQKHGDPCSH